MAESLARPIVPGVQSLTGRLRRPLRGGFFAMARRIERDLRHEAGFDGVELPGDGDRPVRYPLPRWLLLFVLGSGLSIVGGGFGVALKLGYYQAKLESLQAGVTEHIHREGTWEETERAYVQSLSILMAKSGVPVPPPPKLEQEK